MGQPARALSPAEQQAYADDGFVVVRGLIEADEARRLDAEVERMGRVGNPAAPEGWIFALHQQESSLCADFAHDERVLSLVAGVVSPGIGLHSSKLVTKMPRSEEVCHWHQDESYYLESGEAEMRSDMRMSIWVPLQDVTAENGCLWVVPGSHRDGVASHREVGDGHCRRKIIRSDYADEHAVPLLLDAGDAAVQRFPVAPLARQPDRAGPPRVHRVLPGGEHPARRLRRRHPGPAARLISSGTAAG